jgi:hypothetical protein
MNTKTPEKGASERTRQSGRSSGGALRKARAEAVWRWFAVRRRPISIDRQVYWWLAEDGLTKANVDRALDDLVEAGRIELRVEHGHVVVEAIEEAA